MSDRSPALASRRRLAVVFLMMAGLVGPALPARGEDVACAETWGRLAEWAVREEAHGVTAARLARLQDLISRVEECARPGPGTSDGTAGWGPLVAVFFPAEEVDRVLCLMAAESGGDAGARNPVSGASGLMQVMPRWAGVFGYTADQLFDPAVNLWVARRIREMQGWVAWSPYLRGACR